MKKMIKLLFSIFVSSETSTSEINITGIESNVSRIETKIKFLLRTYETNCHCSIVCLLKHMNTPSFAAFQVFSLSLPTVAQVQRCARNTSHARASLRKSLHGTLLTVL